MTFAEFPIDLVEKITARYNIDVLNQGYFCDITAVSTRDLGPNVLHRVWYSERFLSKIELSNKCSWFFRERYIFKDERWLI